MNRKYHKPPRDGYPFVRPGPLEPEVIYARFVRSDWEDLVYVSRILGGGTEDEVQAVRALVSARRPELLHDLDDIIEIGRNEKAIRPGKLIQP